MLPNIFVVLDDFPILPSGKVDRKKLPEPKEDVKDEQRIIVEPRNATEEKIHTVWKKYFAPQLVSVIDDFFELGGHSLLAIRLVSYIERKLSMSIPLNALFEFRTICELSKYLEIQESVNSKHKDTTFQLIDI